MPIEPIHLTSSDPDGSSLVTVTVDVAAGGRIRQITITDEPDSVDLLTGEDGNRSTSSGWGSFPMAPWAGRIRHGRFRFLGDDVRLDLNHVDGSGTGGGPIVPPRPATSGPVAADDRRAHPIHGTTFTRPWTPVSVTADRIEMSCPLEGMLAWPYPGLARQVLTLGPRRLELELAVEPDGDTVFPASIGWHPWFVKPDRLDFAPTAMYVRDEIGIPTGELVRPLPPPWDDCFVNRRPVELHYERRVAPVVTVSSPDCDHWVIYDKPSHATCVEPQSGPPDAPTLRPEIATSDHPLRRSMSITW
ncbi:aldose epimerase [Ilumatobacter sp.]|uniref:aldose epimerase family protein n=1 Tax=Ilumatobacter sp. TaxID=1967498 RepID=UPI003C5437A9